MKTKVLKKVMFNLLLLLKFLVMSISGCLLFTSTIVFAAPEGGQVTNGNATISSPNSQTVQVNQTSDKSIIEWNSFNVGAQEKVQFIQPSSSSITLNRINPGQGVSQIFGLLTANGKIILINQSGIYFGPGSHVDVAGIIASTSNLSNANFLAGNYSFNEASPFAGSIINDGTITARNNGLVALLGTGVVNNGLIQAKLGNVVLASGNTFTITFAGDQLISFAITGSATRAGVDQYGRPLKNGVSNAGKIVANGGAIILTGRAAQGVLDNVINMQGVLIARSVSQHEGVIILSGDEQGIVRISGRLNVSSPKGQGGAIKVMGNIIQIESSAVLNASGKTAGGNILIGINSTTTGQTADYTYIASGAHINANALLNGNGGDISIWSNLATQVYGNISAQGGAISGNGGFVETSGAYLDVTGININLHAPYGTSGMWLLDPENLIIQTAATTTATPSGSPINTYTSNVDTSILTVADLENALANASVLVQTGVGGSQAGNITVANNITWGNANTLTLSAYNNINIDASVMNSFGGSLSVRADNTAIGIGTITFAGATPQITMSGGGVVSFYYNPASFPTATDYSSNVTVSAGTSFIPYMLVNTPAQLENINNNLSGNYALGTTITLNGNFTPLGSAATPFTGQFTGLNNSINNLSLTNTTPNIDLGLFGVTTGATIANVNLQNVTINQTADNSGNSIYIGSLIGLMNGGTLTNSSVTNAFITASGTNQGINGSRGYYDIGGLVGAAFGGTITNSFSSGGSIMDSVNTNPGVGMIAFHEVGGLLGGAHSGVALNNIYSSTAITANGNVTISAANATGEMLIGGLIGRLDQVSSALNSHTSGAVTVSSTMSVSGASSAGYVLVGGLIGVTSLANTNFSSVIDNSYSTSAVTLNATLTNSLPGEAEFLLGGLFGQSNGVLTNSYSTGPVVATLASDSTAIENYLYVGGLAGVNFTIINNSYSTSSVTVSGTNNGNQLEIGGLVGGHITLFDKEITGSYSSGTVNVTMNNLNGGQLYIGGLIGSIIYYGNAATTWPFSNNYSTSAINVSGQNNASLLAVGGLVGTNGQDAGDPGGNIQNSYSQGIINSQVSTVNGGTTEIGGFLGANVGSSATLTNNFWDTDSSGYNQNHGEGDVSGPIAGLTAGCFDGACLNGGTANLSASATYNSAGWDLINIWGITDGQSYPYLRGLNSVTPQAFSGFAPGAVETNISLVENGGVIDTRLTGANGFFYFLEPGGISASTPLLAYVNGGALLGNILFKPVSSSSSVNGLDFANNVITVGSLNTSTLSNTNLVTALGNLSNANILYSILGTNNITLGNNVSFNTTPTTTYILNGNLSGQSTGINNITLAGPVLVTANDILSATNIDFVKTITGASSNIIVDATGTATLGGAVSLANLTVLANAVDINSNAVTTIGSQIYNGVIALGNDTTLTATQVSILNGITGGYSLTLVGQAADSSFSLTGPFSLNNITVTGNTAHNNMLSVNAGGSENWFITGINQGNIVAQGVVGNFNFSGIQNLTGGNSGNNFIFDNNASVTGLINGVNIAKINTLDYSLYSSPLTTTFANQLYAGVTQNNTAAYITHFININNFIGNITFINPSPVGTTPPIANIVTAQDAADAMEISKQSIISVITPYLSGNIDASTPSSLFMSDTIRIISPAISMAGVSIETVTKSIASTSLATIPLMQSMFYNLITNISASVLLVENSSSMLINSKVLVLGNDVKMLSEQNFVDFNNVLWELNNYNPLFIILMLIGLGLTLLRKKSMRELSFNLRTSLNSIISFSNFFSSGISGAATTQAKEYIQEILSGAGLILKELALIESNNVASSDKQRSFNLRTGLMNINGYAGLLSHLKGQINTAEQNDCLAEIRAGSNSILQLIRV